MAGTMSALTVQVELFAIKQTDRETGDSHWRSVSEEDVAPWPALFTDINQAHAYCRVLRKSFKDTLAFTVVRVRTLDLKGLDEPVTIAMESELPRPAAFVPVPAAPGGSIA